ncbi:MAG TPA: hypothetical protein PLF26_16160 [Blastocatellia bacterium]|nr:hypothetical protein [Blastocatellia bacterium]
MRTRWPVVLLLAVLPSLLAATPARSGTGGAVKFDTSVLFDGQTARERFDEYERFLEGDPQRFAAELETLRRLERSDVVYVVRIGKFADKDVEGSLTSDGERIYINVSNTGGVYGEVASLNSRFAHEFEHARQFNDGEVAFLLDPRSHEWRPLITSYDIGDEIKAWKSQLNASLGCDHWFVSSRGRKPTLLHLFAQASTDEERAQLLVQHGYRNRRNLLEVNNVFSDALGYAVGQLLRPSETRNFFGRVWALSHNSRS